MGTFPERLRGEFAMKCFLCKGQLEERLTNFMIDVVIALSS